MRASFVQTIFLCFFFCVSVFAQSTSQPTEDPLDKASVLFEKAEQHYALQEYEESLSLYKEAYRLSSAPELLFNIGQCQRQLKRFEEAEKSYQAYLRSLSTTPQDQARRANTEKLIEEVRAAAAQSKNATTAAPTDTLSNPLKPTSNATTQEPTPDGNPATKTPQSSNASLWYGVSGALGASGALTYALSLSAKAETQRLLAFQDPRLIENIVAQNNRAGTLGGVAAVCLGGAAISAVVGVVSSKKQQELKITTTFTTISITGEF